MSEGMFLSADSTAFEQVTLSKVKRKNEQEWWYPQNKPTYRTDPEMKTQRIVVNETSTNQIIYNFEMINVFNLFQSPQETELFKPENISNSIFI